jgi:alkylation response protein AidB-like acyl-CoA dehydrogenase
VEQEVRETSYLPNAMAPPSGATAGAGLSQDTILPVLYAQARFLQIADGPDQVHRRSLARAEFAATPVLNEVR